MSANKTTFEKLAMALRIIQTWAACDSLSPETRAKAMADIETKCKEALKGSEQENKKDTNANLLAALQQCLAYIERDEQRYGRQLPEGRAARAAIEKAMSEE